MSQPPTGTMESKPPVAAPSADVVAAAPPAAHTPIHKRRWFWPVIGGVAALVVAGVVVGVVLGTRDSGPSTLPELRF